MDEGLSTHRLPMMTSCHENAVRITGSLRRNHPGYPWFPSTKSHLCGALMLIQTSCWTNSRFSLIWDDITFVWHQYRVEGPLPWRHISIIACQITGTSAICAIVCLSLYQTKHQTLASAGRFPNKGPVRRKLYLWRDVIVQWFTI